MLLDSAVDADADTLLLQPSDDDSTLLEEEMNKWIKPPNKNRDVRLKDGDPTILKFSDKS